MSESPECIKNLKSRIRSLFRVTPKNKHCRDGEGSSIDPARSPDCKVDIDWDPVDGKYRKPCGRKKFKLRGGLFSPKPKDVVKVKKISTLNHPFVPYSFNTTQNTSDLHLTGIAEPRATSDGNHSKGTIVTEMAKTGSAQDTGVVPKMSEKTPISICTANETHNSSECPKTMGNQKPKDTREEKVDGVAPLIFDSQDCSIVQSEMQSPKNKSSSIKEPDVRVVHPDLNSAENKGTAKKSDRQQSVLQCSTPDKGKNKSSCNTASFIKEKVVENKYDPTIAIPLPWNVHPNLGKEEVFVFTGSDYTESTLTSSSPKKTIQVLKPVPANRAFFRVTVDNPTQCGLDIFPCTCDITLDGQKVLCENCVDLKHDIIDKVVTGRNKSIRSPSRQRTKCGGTEQVKYLSSETQTILSSFGKTSVNNKDKTESCQENQNVTADRVRRESKIELQVSTGYSQVPNKQDSPISTNKTAVCCNAPATPERSQEQVIKTDPVINAANREHDVDRAIWTSRICDRLGKKVTPSQMKKIEALWSHVGRQGRVSDFLDLANGLTDTSGNIGEMFKSVTTQELDRIDGINRRNRRSENTGEQRLDCGTKVSSGKQEWKEILSPVLGDVGCELISSPEKRRSSRISPRSRLVTQSTPDSKPKRSRSLEDLDLLAVEPPNYQKPFKFRPFEPENVSSEYENPFEISGCIRIDDHIDCGQKAGRGHIPEVKVKQKRRGEPNKHLTAQHWDNDLNLEDELDEIAADNCGDWSVAEEPSESTPDQRDSLLCEGDVSSASNLTAEASDVEEVLADTRHCEKIPLEVIYGKKNDNDNEFDTPVKHSKKKRKQRDRVNRVRPPQILGLRFDI